MQSNSEAAKYMRCAAAEAVISEELARRIFRDFYLTNKLGVSQSSLINAVCLLDTTNKKEASVIRCQFAKASQGPNEVDTDAISYRAAENVCEALSCWLDDKAIKEKLENDLQAIFAEAIKIWLPLQRIRERAWPDTATNPEYWVDRQRPEYDMVKLEEEHRKKQQPPSRLIKPLAVLFPQIVIGSDCIFHGFALLPTQSAVIAAALEVEANGQQMSSSGSPRLRRVSVPTPGVHRRGPDWDLANGSEVHGTHGSSIAGSDMSYLGRIARSQSMRERGESTPTGSVLGQSSRPSP